jgi:anthranilate synthase
MHGKSSKVTVTSQGGKLFEHIPPVFTAARYHSLYARRAALPDCLEVLAETEDGVVMAVRHKTLPIAAVQFHPESILTPSEIGLQLITNALQTLKKEMY